MAWVLSWQQPIKYKQLSSHSTLSDNRGTATVTLKQISTGEEYHVNLNNGINVVQVETDLNSIGRSLSAGQYSVTLRWFGSPTGYHSQSIIFMYDRGILILHPDEIKQFQIEGFASSYGLFDCYAVFPDWSSLGDNSTTIKRHVASSYNWR